MKIPLLPVVRLLMLLLLYVMPFSAAAQNPDSAVLRDSVVNGRVMSQPEPDDEEFNIFLRALLFIAFSLMIGIGFAGAVLTLAIVGAFAVLAAAGVISAGVMVGLCKTSVSAGFRAALYVLLSGYGVVCGIGALWLGNVLFSQQYSVAVILGAGTIFGAIGGWLAAWSGLRVFCFMLRRSFRAKARRLRKGR